MPLLLALALLAADGWIDRVQPDCGVLRAFANRQMDQWKTTQALANDEKDPARKKELQELAEKERAPAQEQVRKYEECRATAPKVMTEEQAKREEEAEGQRQLEGMIERQQHPPGAIAPIPQPQPPPPPPPPPSAEELRWRAQKQKVLDDPRQMKLAKTAWTCWDAGGRSSELKEQKDRREIARLHAAGCYDARVKRLLRCMDRFWANGEKFRAGDACMRPLERVTVEDAP